MMGAFPDGKEDCYDEEPYKVEITKDFYVGKYPVTQKLWKAVMGNNPSHFKGEDRPVERVTWYDCLAFCNKLSEMEGKEPVYQGLDDYQIGRELEDEEEEALREKIVCNWNVNGYRLLSEAEWEYAARAYQTFLYSGLNNPDEVAWYNKNSGGETHPVGQKKPNGFGLYDMSGNVCEWCWDLSAFYPTDFRSDPTGPSKWSEFSFEHVCRGGSYFNDPEFLRVWKRNSLPPAEWGARFGFRLGRTL